MTVSTVQQELFAAEIGTPLKSRESFKSKVPMTMPLDGAKVNPNKHVVISDKLVTLDQAKAIEYIDLPIFEQERDSDRRWVQSYLDEMKAGVFNFTATSLASAWLGDVRYKVNGQHTCWAFGFMPKNYKVTMREVIYRVKSEEALRQLYITYDAGKPRSKQHQTQILAADKDFCEGLTASFASKMCGALTFWTTPNDNTRRRVGVRKSMAIAEKDYPELFGCVGNFAQAASKENSALKRMPVLAAMLGTFERSGRASIEFWQAVADGLTIPAKTDVRYQLRKQLLNMQSRHVTAVTTGKPQPSDEKLYLICLAAWNKWRRGETSRSAIRPAKNRCAFR